MYRAVVGENAVHVVFSDFLISSCSDGNVSYSHAFSSLGMKKLKLSPGTGFGGLQGCKMLIIPHCLDSRLTDGGKFVSLTPAVLYSPETLEVE
jgi:hypothetical protein